MIPAPIASIAYGDSATPADALQQVALNIECTTADVVSAALYAMPLSEVVDFNAPWSESYSAIHESWHDSLDRACGNLSGAALSLEAVLMAGFVWGPFTADTKAKDVLVCARGAITLADFISLAARGGKVGEHALARGECHLAEMLADGTALYYPVCESALYLVRMRFNQNPLVPAHFVVTRAPPPQRDFNLRGSLEEFAETNDAVANITMDTDSQNTEPVSMEEACEFMMTQLKCKLVKAHSRNCEHPLSFVYQDGSSGYFLAASSTLLSKSGVEAGYLGSLEGLHAEHLGSEWKLLRFDLDNTDWASMSVKDTRARLYDMFSAGEPSQKRHRPK